MEEFDIMDDAAIQRRMEEQHKRVEMLRSSCTLKKKEKELREMLAEAGKLLDQYLKTAVCEGEPVRAEFGCLELNPTAEMGRSLSDTFAVFKYRERSIIIKYGRSVSVWNRDEEDYYDSDETEKTTFYFYYGYEAPCSSLNDQYDAAKDMLRCLKQNSTDIMESINDAVNDSILAITKKTGNGYAPYFYDTKELDGDDD